MMLDALKLKGIPILVTGEIIVPATFSRRVGQKIGVLIPPLLAHLKRLYLHFWRDLWFSDGRVVLRKLHDAIRFRASRWQQRRRRTTRNNKQCKQQCNFHCQIVAPSLSEERGLISPSRGMK